MVKVLKFGLKFWAVKVGVWLGAAWWGKVLTFVVRCVRSSSVACEALPQPVFGRSEVCRVCVAK